MQKRESNSRGGGLGRVVRFGTTQHHSIPYKVLKARGWREVDDDSWDFFYADVGWIHENVPYATSGNQGMKLQDHQRVNHYPNHVELTRKDLMAKNLKRSIKNAVRDTWYTREGLEGLSEEDRIALMPHFEADIRATEILIGRNLGHWLAH